MKKGLTHGLLLIASFVGFILGQNAVEFSLNDVQDVDTDDNNSSENIMEALEELKSNADGVNIVLDAVDKVVDNGGETLKIPVEIDPNQHNITLTDALESTSSYLLEQVREAEELLSKLNGLIEESNYSDATLLREYRDEIVDVLQSFSDAEQDISLYLKAIISDDQLYDYYDDDNAEGDENKVDQERSDEGISPSATPTADGLESMTGTYVDDDESFKVANVDHDLTQSKESPGDVATPTADGLESTTGTYVDDDESFKETYVDHDVTQSKENPGDVGAHGYEALFNTHELFLEGGDETIQTNDHGGDNLTPQQFQSLFIEEERIMKEYNNSYEDVSITETRSPYGNSEMNLDEDVTGEDSYDANVDWSETKDELKDLVDKTWYESVWEKEEVAEEPSFPFRIRTAVFVSVAVPLGILLIVLAAFVCRSGVGYRRSVTASARPLSESHSGARVSVISICDSDETKRSPLRKVGLPPYLEVISERVEPKRTSDGKQVFGEK